MTNDQLIRRHPHNRRFVAATPKATRPASRDELLDRYFKTRLGSDEALNLVAKALTADAYLPLKGVEVEEDEDE